MRLVAIYSVWNDWDMLSHSVRILKPLVDGVIIVGSTQSNYGEYSAIPSEWHNNELYVRNPKFRIPMHSETDKRNYGISIAIEQGYTHFISLDADEVYKPDEFQKAKARFKDTNLAGLVCPSVVYFKSPTLTIGRDITLVPHIHKLTPTIRHEFNKLYPYSWIQGQIRIDPTRSLNINSGVEYMDDVEMHHFSHVRKDYEKKIRNSTARKNLERSTIVKDLLEAKEGYFVEFYGKRLTRVENSFGIPEYEFNPDRQAGIRQGL